ncbi:autoinducer 2 ABC transporter substrate-binding protein [Actinomyces sp. Z3]|nr:autoinducer 2 ABC transporter substrate-binding protein [Actinomyces sp. Z3]
MMTRRSVLAGVGVVTAAALAACSSEAPNSGSGPASGASGDEKILMIPKYTGLKYFDVSGDGGRAAAEALGVQYDYIGSQEATATAQSTTITNAIAQKPSAMVVSAIDEDAVAPALKSAMEAGIKVVTYDADSAVDSRSVFVNQLSYELAASSMLDSALQNDPEGGLCAFVSASPTATNHKKHVELMKQLIDSDEKYSSLSYIDTVQYAEDDATKSEEIARNLMQANPDLKFIISSSVVTTPAAAKAIENAGRQGEVFAPGFSMPSSMTQFIEDGTAKAFALWDPAQLGQVAVEVAHQLVAGTITGAEGEKATVEGVGEFEILADGELDVDMPIIFTADNIGQYDF